MATNQNRTSNPVSSNESDCPWREELVLRTLYCEQEYSLRETADYLDCSPETVRRWLHQHDIETRPANHQKTHPCYEVNPEGYAYVKVDHSDGEDRVGIHELIAIAAGADPHEVFSDETHCHHRFRVPSDLDGVMQLDLPANVEVLDAHRHISAHQTDDLEEPAPEQILARIDESPADRRLDAD